MKPATSSRPCIDSPASWIAAIQPSVRASSAATSGAVSASPMTPLRYAAASAGVKRRSAARISTSSPRARSRASGSARVGAGGDDEVHVAPAGGRAGTPSRAWTSRRVDRVVVVEHQHDVAGTALSSLSRGARTASIEGAATSSAARLARRSRAPRRAARRSRAPRTAPFGCRRHRGRATRCAAGDPARTTATRRARSSCRTRPEPTRA